ncbi:hypothetical protein [Streptomyces sp. NPDC056480]|uniref:hypothetical protein n=1 Tax=Streptomyces sp. NPDC056480 TaxID=3345833 RepID=UPI00369C54AE
MAPVRPSGPVPGRTHGTPRSPREPAGPPDRTAAAGAPADPSTLRRPFGEATPGPRRGGARRVRRVRRVRRLVALLLAGMIATVGCTASDDGPSAGPRPATGAAGPGPDRAHPVLAFVQPEKRAVMLADAAGRTWLAARTGAAPPTKVVWSPDARRLAWLDEEGSAGTGEVHIYDVATGKPHSQVCPCHGLGFLGQDLATLAADGSSIALFPPGFPAEPAHRVPLATGRGAYARLAAGGPEDVIVFAALPEGPGVTRGQGTLAAVDRRGTVRDLLPAKGPSTFTDALRSPDGKAVAWGTSDSGGACWTRSTLLTHSGRTATAPVRQLPDDAPFRRALIGDRQRTLSSFAWAGDGITVTYGPLQRCQVPGPDRFVSYYVRDGARTFLGTGMLGIALGADGRVARLAGDESSLGLTRAPSGVTDYTGTLTLTSADRDHTLAKGVSAFAFTPAESAAARRPAAVPQPPAPTVTSVDDHGTRLPDAVVRLARRIEEAAVRGDTAGLVALCGTCRAGVHEWIRGEDGPAAVLRAIRTHPGRNGTEGLMYPGLSSCVDEPGQDITCTTQQLRDVALLGARPDESDVDYGGVVYGTWTGGPPLVPLLFRTHAKGEALWTGLAAG